MTQVSRYVATDHGNVVAPSPNGEDNLLVYMLRQPALRSKIDAMSKGRVRNKLLGRPKKD